MSGSHENEKRVKDMRGLRGEEGGEELLGEEQ